MSLENVRFIIDAPEEFQEPPSLAVSAEKPRLLVEDCNPDRTVARLRDILVAADRLYDRGLPVRLGFRICDPDRQRPKRFGRPCPALCRG
jgi:hypothetical protein